MKKLALSLAIIALLALPAAAQTNIPSVPTDTGSFFQSALGYFTGFNTNLAECFTGHGSFWVGVDSIVGAGANSQPMANEIGANFNLYKGFGLEAVERNSGVSGDVMSLQGGLDYSYVIVDTRLTAYVDPGYELDQSKFLTGVGLRIGKALTEHTFAQIGYELQFKSGPREADANKVGQVFSATVGFTF